MTRLENKVALISGGARGMGAAEVKLFAAEGAKVAIGDVLDEEGRQTEAAINEVGGECLFVHLDVTDEGSWQQAVAETVSRFGKLEFLVNTLESAVAGPCWKTRRWSPGTTSWTSTLRVSFWAPRQLSPPCEKPVVVQS